MVDHPTLECSVEKRKVGIDVPDDMKDFMDCMPCTKRIKIDCNDYMLAEVNDVWEEMDGRSFDQNTLRSTVAKRHADRAQ